MRRLIAERVAEAKSTIPHFYVAREMRMDAAMAAITRLRHAATTAPISINTLILSALAKSLQQHPELNVVFAGDGTLALPSIDIGIAIATSEGVFLPVVRQAATRTLADIQSEMTRLRTAAERRSLQEHEFTQTAMSLSNLGMHGVDSFAAIISRPQVMMLATGRVAQRPVVVDGVVSPASPCTACFRAITASSMVCRRRISCHVPGLTEQQLADRRSGIHPRPATTRSEAKAHRQHLGARRCSANHRHDHLCTLASSSSRSRVMTACFGCRASIKGTSSQVTMDTSWESAETRHGLHAIHR